MPNEPDNKMDDLLKAYAQKRKADAREPLELHPATRRLLQAEAARLRPRQESRSTSWLGLILARWPAIALAVGLFVLLGIGVRLMVPEREHADRQMLARQDAPVDRVATSGERAKKEVEELKDAVALSPRQSRDESVMTRASEAGKSIELAESDARKPGGYADKAPSASPTTPASPPPPARFLRNETATEASPVNSPVRRELDIAQAPRLAPVAAPTARRSPQTAGVASGPIDLFSLGTFTNSSELPEVRLQFTSPQGGGIRGVTGNLIESRVGALPEVQTPVPAPAQEPAVALAKARQNEAARSDNFVPNVAQTQTATAQTLQTAPAQNLGVAKGNEGQLRISGTQGLAAEVRANAGVAPQVPGPQQNYRYAAASGSMGVPRAVVLTSFSLHQRDELVRVLDSDGSIYEGKVLAKDNGAGASPGQTIDGLQRQAEVLVKSAGLKGQGSGVAASRVANFRVAGTNRTLNLPVILEGSLFTEATESAMAPADRAGQRPPAVDRIVGRARIGETNEVRIDAARARN